MASLVMDSEGYWRILFVGTDLKRRSLHLGRMPKKDAITIQSRIETIIAAASAGVSLDRETAEWLGKIGDKLHAKLCKYGLAVERVKVEQFVLAKFIDGYIAGRNDIKPRTKWALEYSRDFLIEFFGESKGLATITHGDADDFRQFMRTRLGENSLRRVCGRAKQFFRAAVRRGLIPASPFADMKDVSVRGNKSREFFVTQEMADAVLTACPDAQWKLIFALSRFGGLRCPSEHLELRRADIDWKQKRFTVRSPKTEQHDGHEDRIVPIFPELSPYLKAVWDHGNRILIRGETEEDAF